MRKSWFAVISIVSVLAWSVPAVAKAGQGKGKGKAEKAEHGEKEHGKPEKAERPERSERGEKGEKRENDDRHEGERPRAVAPRVVGKVPTPAPPIAERTVVIDRDGHRRIVTQYFSRESLPPGLAKRESLPPGLQKQLRERGRLPPGLQKRLVPVSGPLVSQLPVLPPYYNRYFAGRDLVIVDTRTNVIIGIIRDVLTAR